MAIPTKRHQRNTVSYLDTGEITALLAAPDRRTWLGRRDHALMVLMIQTGIASRNSPVCASTMSTSASAPTSASPARDERCAHPR